MGRHLALASRQTGWGAYEGQGDAESDEAAKEEDDTERNQRDAVAQEGGAADEAEGLERGHAHYQERFGWHGVRRRPRQDIADAHFT